MRSVKQLAALLLALAMLLSIAGCAQDSPTPTGTTASTAAPTEPTAPLPSAPSDGTYTVTLTTRGGMAMAGIDVYIYEDSSMTELVTSGSTDENGCVSFDLPKSADYRIDLARVPEGYQVADSYGFTSNVAAITLSSSLITGKSLTGTSLGLGDVMYDFSVLTPSGETVTLSQVLEEKKVALLNFWYTSCGPCANEFPYLEQAYQMYQEDAAVIALDPLEENAAVAAYQAGMGLSFPMAACPAEWAYTFGITGYPTSVVVDRYGVICLVEVGAVTSLRPFDCIFSHFTAQEYEQTLFGSLSELVTSVKPTFSMPSQEEIENVLGTEGVTYRPEADDEYAWPFIVTEKDGIPCLKASNQSIESSYSILYADVQLQAGQAVAFDYLASSEKSCDVLYVIVDGEDVYQISGMDDVPSWDTCYPWVAARDGVHEVALCYLKDGDTNTGDDTVYIKDLRIVDKSQIDTPTYIPCNAAQAGENDTFTYVDIVFSPADGYYHVGSADGPLLLADLMGYTQFWEEKTVWDLVYEGIALCDGENFYEEMVDYFSYASNSQIKGVCPVDALLHEYLRLVGHSAGFFPEDENEWLRICCYYQSYGTDQELSDPIKGLADFCAYTAVEGVGVETNYFYYDRPIMPRGLLAKFVPERSGVYRITSRCNSEHGVDGWIFGEGRQELLTYERDERLGSDPVNVSMVYYMEAGKAYYIDIAFWDLYEVNEVHYDIEYIGQTFDLFRLASPGYFTYDTNATGDQMYALVAGGVDVVLGENGIWYVDLGLDENGGQIYGSPLYADFTGITGLFNMPIATTETVNANGDPVVVKGILDRGGMDFSKTDNDQYVLSFLDRFDGDVQATDEYLRELWGEEYDDLALEYQLEDVYNGIYHGRGEDLTDELAAYLDDMIDDGHEERKGCVIVTEELAELLQMLVDKYSFAGVDHSWTKMCYYYDYLGPQT